MAAYYYSNLGTALQAQGKLDEAATAYRDALDRNPGQAEAYMNLDTQIQGRPDNAAA